MDIPALSIANSANNLQYQAGTLIAKKVMDDTQTQAAQMLSILPNLGKNVDMKV